MDSVKNIFVSYRVSSFPKHYNAELVTHKHAYSDSHIDIQDDSGGKVNNLAGDIIGNFEKKVNMNICLILKIYRARVV